MSDKNKVIRNVYYDADKGSGSINDTYKQAHHIFNTITVNDVNEFLDHIGVLTAMLRKNRYKKYKLSWISHDMLK